jgi:diadenosine tetraphosphate (Ap4A) HIT family hydrolase
MIAPSDCPACAFLAEAGDPPPGGVVHRAGGFALHALAGESPLPGWLVLTSERHVRAWYDLDPAPAAALGPLAQQVMRAQRSALGAEHVYAFAIGDVLRHFHLHLVPRFSDTPERLWGRRCFDGRPEDMRAPDALAAAARAVARAISSGR